MAGIRITHTVSFPTHKTSFPLPFVLFPCQCVSLAFLHANLPCIPKTLIQALKGCFRSGKMLFKKYILEGNNPNNSFKRLSIYPIMPKLFRSLFRSSLPRRQHAPRVAKGLFFLACLPFFMITSLPVDSAGETSSAYGTLDREKWLWHSWFEDFIPPFFEETGPMLPEASFRSCWECGLWTNEAWPLAWNPPALREPMAFQKAQCYQAVGMHEAALDAYRKIIRENPEGEKTAACIDAVIHILYHNGNLEAAVAFYNRLGPGHQTLASPESLYLLGQSCYRLNRDEQASAFLEKVPPAAEIYPLALYTRIQIAFRSGQAEQALEGLRTLTRSEETPGVPEMLREQARLTLARILFQQEEYEEAARAYRTLSRSRFFLPEALMGTGWCYEAMGKPGGAISFFQAAEKAASRDFLTRAMAQLEQARLYAASGVHTDAFGLFRQTQDRIREYVSFLNRHAENPAWLEGQTGRLLPEKDRQTETPPAPAADDTSPKQDEPAIPLPSLEATTGDPEFQEEIASVLTKQSYISPRMLQLYVVRDALIQIESLLDRGPVQETVHRIRRGMSTRPYPPLETRESMLDPESIHLLDVSFALLDTEYRLDNLAASLGLTDPEERKRFHEELRPFYQQALQAVILLPSGDKQDAFETLNRLMTVVRYLPGSIEERGLILKKLVYTKKSILDAEQNLRRWAHTMEGTGSGEFQNPRPLMDRLWMIYVRSLIHFRTWEERSPGTFLLPQIIPEPSEDAAAAPPPAERQELLANRIQTLWQRLDGFFRKEIRTFNEERLASFEKLLTDSELYYAEALLKHQKSLLDELQDTPRQPDEENAPAPDAADTEPPPDSDGSGTRPSNPDGFPETGSP